MGYCFESRVRFSEVGTDGRLTLPGILDYYQDCCTFQAASIHQGTRETRARNRVWVLNSWQVIVYRYPEQGENIRIGTYPYRLHSFFGHRNFDMKTEDGELLSIGNSVWTNLNIQTGMPERLKEEDIRGYALDEKMDMPYAARKIFLPENARAEDPFVIQKHHLDVNGHVNNCQYVRMAMDYLPENSKVTELRAEYRKQAFQNDVFYPMVGHEEDLTIVSFRTEEGECFASVEVRVPR